MGTFSSQKLAPAPTAVSALRPRRGTGERRVPHPPLGQVTRKPGLEFNCASKRDGFAISRAPWPGFHYPGTRERNLKGMGPRSHFLRTLQAWNLRCIKDFQWLLPKLSSHGVYRSPSLPGPHRVEKREGSPGSSLHQAVSQGLGCKHVWEGLSPVILGTPVLSTRDPSAQLSLTPTTLDISSRMKIISGMRNWYPEQLSRSSKVTDIVTMTPEFKLRQSVFWGPRPHPDSTFSLPGPPAHELLVHRLQTGGTLVHQHEQIS